LSAVHVVVLGPLVIWFERPQIGVDTAKYLFSGLSTVNGQITYRYVWDVKPPGIHLLSSGLHLLGLNRTATYLAGVAVMGAAVLATAAVAAELVSEFTGSPSAAISSSLVLVSVEAYGGVWLHGLMGKFLVPLCGVAAILLLRRDRPLAAVAVGTLAAAFWQFAVIVPLTVYVAAVAAADRKSQWARAVRGAITMGTVAAAVCLPYVLAGAGGEMVSQTVLVSLVSEQAYGGTGVFGWLSYLDNFGHALPLFAAGAAGIAALGFRARTTRDPATTALVVQAVWFTVAGGVLSQVGPLDTIAMVPYVAVGVGVCVGLVPRTPLTTVDAALPAVSARTGVVLLLAVFGALSLAYYAPYPPYVFGPTDAGIAYLEGAPPGGCHEHLNRIGQWWVDAVGPAGEECRDLGETLSPLRGS
jgi:hypothetical protein